MRGKRCGLNHDNNMAKVGLMYTGKCQNPFRPTRTHTTIKLQLVSDITSPASISCFNFLSIKDRHL